MLHSTYCTQQVYSIAKRWRIGISDTNVRDKVRTGSLNSDIRYKIQLKAFSIERLRRGRGLLREGGRHRLNMELDLQSLFGLHTLSRDVHSCSQLFSLAETTQPPPPHLGSYTRGAMGQLGQTTYPCNSLVGGVGGLLREGGGWRGEEVSVRGRQNWTEEGGR